jgi:hypothetical protein
VKCSITINTPTNIAIGSPKNRDLTLTGEERLIYETVARSSKGFRTAAQYRYEIHGVLGNNDELS